MHHLKVLGGKEGRKVGEGRARWLVFCVLHRAGVSDGGSRGLIYLKQGLGGGTSHDLSGGMRESPVRRLGRERAPDLGACSIRRPARGFPAHPRASPTFPQHATPPPIPPSVPSNPHAPWRRTAVTRSARRASDRSRAQPHSDSPPFLVPLRPLRAGRLHPLLRVPRRPASHALPLQGECAGQEAKHARSERGLAGAGMEVGGLWSVWERGTQVGLSLGVGVLRGRRRGLAPGLGHRRGARGERDRATWCRLRARPKGGLCGR